MIKSVAFFGLGAMGAPMAENLLKAGFTVHSAVNRSRAAADDLRERCGLRVFDSFAEAARGVDAVVTILPADAEVKSFLMDERLAAAAGEGAVVVDMSSCTTGAIREVEAWYAPRGVPVVDAPVSGGVDGAAAGSLTIFASGEPRALERVRPLFDAMGEKVFDLGACGAGKAFKNLNNLLSAVNLVAVSEMYRAARANGFDMDKLYGVICESSGMSMSFKNRFRKMVNGDFAGGFKQELARKDVANALALGGGVPMPLGRLAHELLLANRAHDGLDMSCICKLFELDE